MAKKQRNPFPRAAVANLMARTEEYLSIETDTSKQVLNELKERLKDEEKVRGFTCLIYGESGTGKTHILRECMQLALSEQSPDIIVVETSNSLFFETFVSQFRNIISDERLLEYLDNEFIEYLCTEILSEIDAAELRKRQAASDNNNFSIDDFCRDINQKPKSLKQMFWDQADYVISPTTKSALQALHFEDSTSSDWMAFSEKCFDGVQDKDHFLELLRVVLRLMKNSGDMLFIFADEVEKIFSDLSDEDLAKTRSFLKILLETCSTFRHILVIAGLPDFLDFDNVPDEIQQRFHLRVSPSKWDKDDVKTFISAVIKKAGAGNVSLTMPAVKSLLDVTGGIPRLTIRSLYQIYSDAILDKDKTKVSKDDVIKVTRGMYEVRSEDGVSTEIETVIKDKNLPYSVPLLQQDSNQESEILPDFIINVSEVNIINVLITHSLIERRDLQKYEEIASSAKQNGADGDDITNFFIVNGYISPVIRNRLKSLGQNKILYVRPSYFDDDFAEAIENIIETHKRIQEFSSIQDISARLHRLTDVIQFNLSRSDRRFEEVEHRILRQLPQTASHANEQVEGLEFFQLVFKGEIYDEVAALKKPLDLYMFLCRSLVKSLQINDGDVGYSRGKMYRNDLTFHLQDEQILNQFLGTISLVTWIMSDFCEQLARIKLNVISEEISHKPKSVRYMAKNTQRLLRHNVRILVDLEGEFRFIFDRAAKLDLNSNEIDEDDSKILEQLRYSKIQFDEISELPLRLIKRARLY